jgi:glycosyltransferase involved in cell wall biosynthesis
MKLLIFADTTHPSQGVSHMIKFMLQGLKNNPKIQLYHVNTKFSSGAHDIGRAKFGKLLLLLKYLTHAAWLRIIHRINYFYYVPAPTKHTVMLRDIVVMLFCRFFFFKRILHWHSLGLGQWVTENSHSKFARLMHWLLSNAELSISLTEYGRADAAVFSAKHTVVVPNGIPDPCPDFALTLLPSRLSYPKKSYHILYMAHCTKEKGLFDTLSAISILHKQTNFNFHLTVAGQFPNVVEQERFNHYIQQENLHQVVHYIGFVQGKDKDTLLRQCDCLCFPSFFHTEAQPVVLIESLAYGMNIVTSNWRALPECLPSEEKHVVPIHRPDLLAKALQTTASHPSVIINRQHFLTHYNVNQMILNLKQAFADCSAM